MRRGTLVLAAGLVAGAAAMLAAGDRLYGAVGEKADVPTYAGCLSAESGSFYGFNGQEQCDPGDQPVQLSSGDIASVAGGEGIDGGGDNGAVQVELDPKYRLPQDCAPGASVAYGGGAWACAPPLEPTDFAKSDQSCPPGTVVAGISRLGTLVCVERGSSGPSTEWTGVMTSMVEQRRCGGCVNHVVVYNPNAAPATMTVRAFDREGVELVVRHFARGTPVCRGIRVPPGGSRQCYVNPAPDFVEGAVVVYADLPVLPFGVVPEANGPGHAWQLDWYPFCPDHVPGGCFD